MATARIWLAKNRVKQNVQLGGALRPWSCPAAGIGVGLLTVKWNGGTRTGKAAPRSLIWGDGSGMAGRTRLGPLDEGTKKPRTGSDPAGA